MNMYVSNLGFSLNDEDLRQFFTSFGEVSSAKIITDRATGQSRGFGFVVMDNDVDAKTAMAELNEAMVEGRAMKVSQAKPREERSSSYSKSW